jgi:hypothetical protein
MKKNNPNNPLASQSLLLPIIPTIIGVPFIPVESL